MTALHQHVYLLGWAPAAAARVWCGGEHKRQEWMGWSERGRQGGEDGVTATCSGGQLCQSTGDADCTL
jgi:hypothetical protein